MGERTNLQPTLWDDTDSLLADWIAWQRMQALSERTITERVIAVRAFLTMQGCTPRTMSTMDIARYCGRVELSASSRHTYQGVLRAFAGWMVKAGVRPDDPSAAAPIPKRPRSRPRPIKMEVVRAIYKAINRERSRAYFMLALLAGMRVHEIAKIRGEDIDLERGSLTISGKGGSTQLIPLAPELRELAERMPRRGWWFPAYTIEGCVTRDAVGRAIKQAMKRAGYGDLMPHQLRHSYGTELLRAGADVRTVQELMRHEDLNTTQGYVDPGWDAMVCAVEMLRLAA